MTTITEPQVKTSSILIVDDTPANVAVLEAHLVNHGFSVMVAQDGDEGFDRAVGELAVFQEA